MYQLIEALVKANSYLSIKRSALDSDELLQANLINLKRDSIIGHVQEAP